MNNKIIYINSIAAGGWISIAAITSLNAPAALSPFIFAIGLIVIIAQKYYLFTGQAGRKYILNQPGFLFKVWLGNLIGTGAVFFLSNASIAEKVIPMMDAKIHNPFHIIFLKGVFCGMIMYIATQVIMKNTLSVILCVASFIIAGFEHSIADMAYFWFYTRATQTIDLRILIFIFIVSCGNLVGAQLLRVADNIRNKE